MDITLGMLILYVRLEFKILDKTQAMQEELLFWVPCQLLKLTQTQSNESNLSEIPENQKT
jgi:hypothetical protein